MTRRSSAPGFALVEALTALVLLAIVLAGSALLLVQAIGHERSAGERSIALRHATSLAEALRALARSDGRPLQAIADPAAMPDCPASPGDCVAEAQALREVERWREVAAADLPAGAVATVALAAGPPLAYHVALSWPASGPGPRQSVRVLAEP